MQAPYVAAPDLLTAANDRQPLDRAPRHAEVTDGALYIHLHTRISEEEYRWRRWQSYTRSDRPMSADAALHLGQRRTENVILPLSPALLSALRAEADALKLTVPAYIAHVLERVDRAQVGIPTPQTPHSAGHLVRMARAADTPLSAAEMIARGIPPASDEAWLRARVAEGMSYTEMAETWGGSTSVYSKWGRRFGIKRDRTAMMKRIWQSKQ